MVWQETQEKYPDQWLVIEALEAYNANDLRCVERIAVVAACEDGNQAFQIYQVMHQQHPEHEFYFVHTSREDLQLEMRYRVDI